jgi:lipoprotein-releasing system ATP-binding protein
MLLSLQNIVKSYTNPGNNNIRKVLDNVSLNVESCDSIAIVGPSGSGKSTLLNIIGTLDAPTSGSVLFRGQEIGSLPEAELANIRNQHIGFVFQMHYLLPQLSLIENVLVPLIPQQNKEKRKAATSRAMDLLKTVGLIDRIHQLPSQLSGGECQRAAVVRALINEPELLLADEPTGSLDQHSASQMGELLSDINKNFGVTTIVVTHSTELANKMKVIYNLTDNKLVKR